MNGSLISSSGVRSQKTDKQLHNRVLETLHISGYLPLRKLSVIAHEGHVALHGRVPTYYLKQLAQCAAMSVRGVESIKNNVEVF